MSRSNLISLKEALKKVVDNYQLSQKLNEVKLNDLWEELAGKTIKEHTTRIEIKEKTLYIKVDSSVVRQELNFIKSRLKKVINNRFGSEYINQITVL